jgi:hypothetical protein
MEEEENPKSWRGIWTTKYFTAINKLQEADTQIFYWQITQPSTTTQQSVLGQ